MKIEGKTGKYRDSGHLLHFLLCFSFPHFLLCNGKGWVRRCSRLLVCHTGCHSWDSRNWYRLCNTCLHWKHPACQSRAIFHFPALAVIPPSAGSTEAELLSCQQLLTRGQFLRRIIVAKKKKNKLMNNTRIKLFICLAVSTGFSLICVSAVVRRLFFPLPFV